MSLLPLEWCVAHPTWWACWGECLEGLWVCGWLVASLGGHNSLTEANLPLNRTPPPNNGLGPSFLHLGLTCCCPHLVGEVGRVVGKSPWRLGEF
jgi:hypothetical protein